MLAAPIDAKKGQHYSQLVFPGVASAKLDGIRALQMNGKPMSRKFKVIPNRHVQAMCDSLDLKGLDGEFITYTNGKMDGFNDVQSKIMDAKGRPDFKFCVFDKWDVEPWTLYVDRVWAYKQQVEALQQKFPFLRAVKTRVVNSVAELEAFTEECLAAGYEGSMYRTPHGPYKYGRSTFREGYLVKIKPFEDAEGVIIGFVEGQTNMNEATKDALGHTKRSSHKANKVNNGELGKLILMTEEFGEISLTAGGTDAERAKIWANRPAYVGKIVTYKFQRIGMKDKPRIATFKGFRHPDDL